MKRLHKRLHTKEVLTEQVEQQLAIEVLRSEILRARVMLALFLVSAGGFTLFRLAMPHFLPAPLLGQNGWFPVVFLVLFSFYEWVVLLYLRRQESQNKNLSIFFQYFSALEEASLVTVALFISRFLFEQNDPEVLITPIPFMYFLFIAVSALRLNFGVSLFTGVVAGLGYFYFVHNTLGGVDVTSNDGAIIFSLINFAERAAIMMATGLVTGLVTRQIRAQVLKSFESAQERAEIISLFGQHVSPEVVDKLLQQGTERISEFRHVCVMFLDIRDYTKFSQGKKPEEVVNYLNTLFTILIDIVNDHNGIINKFLGDGFMAVFGAPISDNGIDTQNAVNASFALLEAVDQACSSGVIDPTRIGIGLHAGEAITGDVGSARRKEYTVIGDVVNMASRIEALNKRFSSQFLVSKEVWDAVSGDSISGESLGQVEVRGVSEKVEIIKLG